MLVVDDKRDAAETLALLIRVSGHEVQLAFDGAEAVDIIENWIPDIAFIDIGLPRMNGYDVARRIRQQSRLNSVVLIAHSGYGQETDRQRAREAGFDDHLVKPADNEADRRALSSSRPASG